jgi:hypothetical protein
MIRYSYRLFIRLFIPFFTLILAACAHTPPSPPLEGRKPMTLASAFQGTVVGNGVFRVPLTGLERRFHAVLRGQLRGNTLTVVEDFVYEDGEKERLTWRFTRTSPSTWTGIREDTVGVANVVEDGQEVRLTYTADIRSKGSTTRLSFADVLTQRKDGTILNEAIATRFGVPIGNIYLEMKRR